MTSGTNLKKNWGKLREMLKPHFPHPEKREWVREEASNGFFWCNWREREKERERSSLKVFSTEKRLYIKCYLMLVGEDKLAFVATILCH